ncbi:hypothetical protein [Paraclostridium bifermentans]|uniref:hypothetical protein n=1 Tax=Paraclostridium bifermentans TaxID=1490 RepID=UPI001897F452|nr:hypothetical protein [Paraclostridium bifermentans]
MEKYQFTEEEVEVLREKAKEDIILIVETMDYERLKLFYIIFNKLGSFTLRTLNNINSFLREL